MKRDLMGRSRTNFARKPTAGKKTRRGGGLVLGLPLDKQPQSLLPAARALTIELMLPAGDLLGLMEEYAVLLQGRSVIKNVASSTAGVPMPMQHMPMPRLCQGCAVILFIFVYNRPRMMLQIALNMPDHTGVYVQGRYLEMRRRRRCVSVMVSLWQRM